MKDFDFRALEAADLEQLASWRYESSWSSYDAPLADGAPATGEAHAVLRDGELVGFCTFGADGRVPGGPTDEVALDVGAGMAPELVGRGSGSRFLGAIVHFARGRSAGRPLRCSIAAWNERALRAARAAGFEESDRFDTPDGRDFVLLLCEPD